MDKHHKMFRNQRDSLIADYQYAMKSNILPI